MLERLRLMLERFNSNLPATCFAVADAGMPNAGGPSVTSLLA